MNKPPKEKIPKKRRRPFKEKVEPGEPKKPKGRPKGRKPKPPPQNPIGRPRIRPVGYRRFPKDPNYFKKFYINITKPLK